MSRLTFNTICMAAAAALVTLMLPMAAWADVPNPVPSIPRCGALGGAGLSLLLITCGCWVVRAQLRPRK